MRLTEKDTVKELLTLKKNKVLMTNNDYKELKLGQLENIEEKHNISSLDDLENRLIALDILKEKKVNLEYIKSCSNYEQYKTICSYYNEITKEEFDLLKKVLI